MVLAFPPACYREERSARGVTGECHISCTCGPAAVVLATGVLADAEGDSSGARLDVTLKVAGALVACVSLCTLQVQALRCCRRFEQSAACANWL